MNRSGSRRRRLGDDVPLGDVLDFMRLIWSVDHALHKTSKRMVRTCGLTGPQRVVLLLVNRFPGLLPGELARILRLDPSTLTGILSRLQRRGLLERRTDATDRRCTHLHVTARGKPLTRPLRGTVEAAVRQMLSELPRSCIEAASTVLTALARALDSRSSS